MFSNPSFPLSFINSRSHSPAVVIVADSGPWVINPFNYFGLCLFAPVVLSYCKYVLFCSRGSSDCPILGIHRYLSLLVSRAPRSTGPFRCSWCIGNTLGCSFLWECFLHVEDDRGGAPCGLASMKSRRGIEGNPALYG